MEIIFLFRCSALLILYGRTIGLVRYLYVDQNALTFQKLRQVKDTEATHTAAVLTVELDAQLAATVVAVTVVVDERMVAVAIVPQNPTANPG